MNSNSQAKQGKTLCSCFRSKALLRITALLVLASFSYFWISSYYRSKSKRTNEFVVGPIHTARAASLCCPRVYIYSIADIEKRASDIVGKPLQITDIDPLNRFSLRLSFARNTSIAAKDRISVLNDALKDVPTQLKIPYNWDVKEFVTISKDYINMFLLRLALSDCITTDPKEAELFIFPAAIHTSRAYDGHRQGTNRDWEKLFSTLDNYQRLFEHFNCETASKHVIFSRSYGHVKSSVGLWTETHLDPRVRNMQRIALGPTGTLISEQPWYLRVAYPLLGLFANQMRDKYDSMFYIDSMVHNVHSIPFCSLLVYPESALSSLNQINRTNLVSSYHAVDHGAQRELKIILNTQCDASVRCVNGHSNNSFNVADALKIKSESIFCLEPRGDWPTRQSIVQDILLGCIPVFFSPEQYMLWNAVWGSWVRDASIMVDPKVVLEDKVDVIEMLEQLPIEEIRWKQQLIWQNAKRFIYLHLDDYMDVGSNYKHTCAVDAANLILAELKHYSLAENSHC